MNMKGSLKKRPSLAYEDESISRHEHCMKKCPAPAHWRTVFEGIQTMRSYMQAPVDTMGCASLSDASYPLPIQRYHVLVGLMLSSQTKDEITAAAMKRLQMQFPSEPMGPRQLLTLSIDEIAELIKPVGFYRRKAKYIAEASKIVLEENDGDIPDSVDKLMALPGVGPKMAYICMQAAWNKSIGIGVDVHVHRISNRLGWAHSTEPEQTRKELEDWLPQEYWSTVNKLFVGFGQTICTALRPKCHDCSVSQYCPYYLKSSECKRQKREHF